VVALLCGAFVLLGFVFAVGTPMFGNFDEQTHLDRARYTERHPFDSVGPELRRTHGSWDSLIAVDVARRDPPDDPAAYRGTYLRFADYVDGNAPQSTGCPGTCQNIQYPHPPGWYLLTAPITAVLDGRPFPSTVLAVRLFDVVLVAPVVALTWLTAREVWPHHPRRRLGATALVALMAPFAYAASAVNNDALLFLTVGVAIYLGTRILRRGPTIGAAALFGAVVSIGLLTKVQMVLVTPAFGLLVLLAPGTARQRKQGAAAFTALALPGALWWLNSLLSSNPLAPKGSELLAPPSRGPWNDENYVLYAVRKVPTLVGRFWGIYDSPVTFLPTPVQIVLSGLAVALGVAWLVTRTWTLPTEEQLRWCVLAALPASLVAGVLQASVSAYRRTGELRALAPRYVYPALPVLAIGAVAAAAAVADARGWRVPRWALPAVLATAAAGVVASVARAGHAAYGTSSLSTLLDEARSVSPIGRPAPVLLAVAVGWACCTLLAIALAARSWEAEKVPR
jgi:4-amino-4-deoxy-L-arabinose transferase-like glycosyltransferase